ncbi:class I SAM-dependent methyltransferase [Betaproteobacteria bacterium]|nr:class I SAM-dependent methyltransferase [Betaproteobacteria bacterium]
MKNKIYMRTESPISILAQRLKKLKNSLTNSRSLMKDEISDLNSIINMMENLEKYVDACTSSESPHLSKLNQLTMQTDWDKVFSDQKSETRLMTQMMSSKVSGQLLKMLVSISKAKTVLELGLFSGYSALAMAEGLPEDGKLISCEIDPYSVDFARKYLDSTPLGHKIQTRLGSALNLLDDLASEGEVFDFVFIDARKTEYQRYVNKLLSNNLVTKNSILCIDNVFMKGACFSEDEKQTKGSIEVKKLNTQLSSEKFFTVMLPLRDGMTIAKLR